MDRLAIIDSEARRFSEVLSDTDPDSRVPTCPDWSAADLLWHLAEVHFFWAAILKRGALTDADAGAAEESTPARPNAIEEILRLRASATDQLTDQLARLDDAEPRWSWWPADQSVGFTRRMQTYEATMHRVDAELTAGLSIGPIDTHVAAGAVDHCVDVMWGWLEPWATYRPQAVVELVATDTDQRWLVEVGHWNGTDPDDGKSWDEPRAVRATDGQPAARVSAPVVDLGLWAWTRSRSAQVEGEPTAIAALDRLIGEGIQ